MEITREKLQKRYSSMDDDSLMELYHQDTLTPIAKDAIQVELSSRGLLPNKLEPEEAYKVIAKKIVIAALNYGNNIKAPSNKVSVEVGAEMLYFLLHYIDRQAFGQLGASERDTVFDEVSRIAIHDYADTVLKAGAPKEVIDRNIEQMINTLNLRQQVYGQCGSMMGETFPGKGTMVFALCFFVHRALGHTERDDVDDILTGSRDLNDSDLEDFPDLPEIMETAATVATVLKAISIQDEFQSLK